MVTPGSGPGPWPDLPYCAPNRWYQAPTQGSATTLITTVAQCYLVPFTPGWECVLAAVGINVSLLGLGTSMRGGLVLGSPDTGLPLTLVQDFGTVATSTGGNKIWSGLSITLEPRPYFFALAGTGGICTLSARTGLDPTVAAAAISFSDANAYSMTGVTGALPTDFTSATTSTVAPIAAFQLT